MIIYGLVLLLTGSLNKDELRMVPLIGPQLACFTERIRSFRIFNRKESQ